MITLVIGGAASGKSEYAEELILASPLRPRIYIATMEPFGAEGQARIARHRELRRGKGFQTVERYTGIAGLKLPAGGAVLLECLGNLAANELYSPAGAGTAEGAASAVADGVDALLAQCGELVAVGNEVCSGGRDYAGDTERYLRTLAEIHRRLARRADRVCEVVCGIPVWHKGAGA